MSSIDVKNEKKATFQQNIRLKISQTPKNQRRSQSQHINFPTQNSPFSTSKKGSKLNQLNVESFELYNAFFNDNVSNSHQQIKQEKKQKQNRIEELMLISKLDNEDQDKEFQLKNLNKQEYLDLKINSAFKQIRDYTNKEQIHEAIRLLDNKEERSLLIDKILKKKQERIDADQIVQISKVQPLVNRFMRKMKKTTEDIDSPPPSPKPPLTKDLNSQLSNMSEKSLKDKLQSSKWLKLPKHNSQNSSQELQKRQEEQENQSNPETDNTNLKANVQQEKKQPSIGSKVLFLSVFSQKKDDDSLKKDKISQISAFKEQFQKITASAGKKINFNQVSENSNQLINKGKEQARKKVNELLKDVQKQSLAAHFKSFSLKNRFDQKYSKNDKEINTFNTDQVEKEMKRDKEKMMNYTNFQNQLDASKVVQNEVIGYIDKYQKNPDEFLVYSRLIAQPYIRQIENQLHKNCQDIAIQKQQQYQNKQPLQYKKEVLSKYNKLFLNHKKTQVRQRKPSISNYFGDQLNKSSSFHQDFSSCIETHTRISQGQLIDCYQRRKSYTMHRPKDKSPMNITKGFQTAREPLSPRSPRQSWQMDRVLTSPKIQSTLQSLTTTAMSRVRTPEQNYEFQKYKIGFTKRKFFSYQNEQDFLSDNPPQKDILCLEKEDGEIKKENHIKTIQMNQRIGQKLQCIKTVDKWKLDGSIHFSGYDNGRSQNEKAKDDDTLVSFTEIKLDKLYRQTLSIQNQQKFLERMQDYNSNILKRYQKEEYQKTTEKNKNNLQQVKNDIYHTTQYKLKPRGKFQIQIS